MPGTLTRLCLPESAKWSVSVSRSALSPLSGGSIDKLLCEFGPFDETVIVKYLKQVVMGVSYLHENRVIHRDLKGMYVVLLGTSYVHMYVRLWLLFTAVLLLCSNFSTCF